MDGSGRGLPFFIIFSSLSAVAVYIAIEINISLFLLFKRRRGLYFWSCALSSWGILVQPFFNILSVFHLWRDVVPSMLVLYLTWAIIVVPQSWVLYSRLHLLISNTRIEQGIKYALFSTSILLSIPTIIVGILAVSTLG